MRSGATTIVPLPRKCNVSRTASSWASRSSWARSSSPVASGTRDVRFVVDVRRGGVAGAGDDLLRAARAVALAPAEAGVVGDHLAKLQDPVDERLGTRGAAGDVDVDRHELVGRDDRVVVE